jgi:molybdenum transport protein
VDAVAAVNPQVKVACSRKTVPLTRALSSMAIKAGGAIPHRLGLSETILVFAEHRVFLPDASFKELAARLRREAPEKKPGIEVASVEEAREAIEAGFGIVQLEKMAPASVAEVVKFARDSRSGAVIAAAGGIGPSNAREYAEAGAGLIVSSWPYTARPSDVKVTIGPA